ncbi:MAG: polysaccharide pyruvyl transferase family protein [Porticoccaceae bacterium]
MYFHTSQGNFGDELNRWLWPRIIGNCISGFGHHGDTGTHAGEPNEILFYGIGTILDDRIPRHAEKIIFGSGCGYGQRLKTIDHAKIFFVRGKHTAQALNLPPEKGLTDPAILLRHFFPVVAGQDRTHEVSVIPHYSSVKGDFWKKACDDLQLNYIDPRSTDIQAVVAEISSSKLVIAEAMHGAIVADAFRVPWIAISSVKETNDFKWRDWCESLDLRYNPAHFTAIYENSAQKRFKEGLNTLKLKLRKHQLGRTASLRKTALLSDERILSSHLRAMDQHLEELKDYLHKRGLG